MKYCVGLPYDFPFGRFSRYSVVRGCLLWVHSLLICYVLPMPNKIYAVPRAEKRNTVQYRFTSVSISIFNGTNWNFRHSLKAAMKGLSGHLDWNSISWMTSFRGPIVVIYIICDYDNSNNDNNDDNNCNSNNSDDDDNHHDENDDNNNIVIIILKQNSDIICKAAHLSVGTLEHISVKL